MAYRRKKKSNKALSLIFIIIAIAVAIFGYLTANNETPANPPIDPNGVEMAIHFIDVGQGDSTLFQTPQGSVLVDCGEKEYGDDVVAYLNAQGITELEYFIITHPDSDHMGCAAYVLENIKVKNFVMNGQEKTTQFFKKALEIVEEQEQAGTLKPIIAGPGDDFTVGALRLNIFGPQPELVETDEWNEASLIIYATYGERAFLLTGDAETQGEADLLEYYKNQIKCDIFSAGHHGSSTSNSKELLQAARPTYVVISCGEGNSYGHPHQEALDSFESVGAIVYRTDELGSVVFITDGKELTKK